MLNYKNTSVAFLICTIVFFISGVYDSSIALSIYLLIVLIYFFLLTLGAVRIQMNFYLKAIISGSPDKAKVALTFDDGPDEKTTEILLKVLENHQIKATFFCIGNKVGNNESVLKKINENGHLIGNHSWSHAFLFDFLLPSKMVREIKKTDATIENITGVNTKLFRPPYGVTNPFLAKALKRTGHTVVGWSLRTFDTTDNKKKVLNRIESRLKNGDIILLHDANLNTINILEDVIQIIKGKGKEIIRLDELLNMSSEG